MRSGTDGYSPRQLQGRLLLCLWLLLSIPAASSKHACGYSNRLCQWQSSYAFAATVVEDKVFYHGGTKANSPGAVNSLNLEVLDLQGLSPLVVEAQRSSNLPEFEISSRYSHQLVTWKNWLLLFGGRREYSPGVNEEDDNTLISFFDLNNRTWSRLQPGNIKLPALESELFSKRLYEAVTVSGDTLLAVVQTTSSKTPRSFVALNLATGRSMLKPTPGKSDGAGLLEWRLVGLMAGLEGNNQSALAVQAKHSIPACSPDSINWFANNDVWKNHSAVNVSCEATTRLKQAQGPVRADARMDGAQVLMLKLLRLQGRPSLVMLAKSVVTLRASAVGTDIKQNVTIVLVHDIVMRGSSGSKSSSSSSSTANKTRSLSLQLRHLLLTPPLGHTLSQLQSVVLPLHGHVLVGPGDGVIELPYVGNLGLVSPADTNFASILEVQGGFVIRGLGRADQSCQPGADWAPFFIHVGFKGQGRPVVSARSNFSWCVSRSTQAASERVVADVQSLATNGQLLQVEGPSGPLLMLIGPQTDPNSGTFNEYFPWIKEPYMGTYINLRDSKAHNFTVTLDKGYDKTRPSRTASCVTTLGRQPVYVETGGAYFDDTYGTNKGVFTMDVLGPGGAQHKLVRATGGDVVPQRAQAALACGPDGQVWMFGGASLVSPKDGDWAPSDELVTFRITRSGAGADSKPNSSLAGTEAAVEPPVKHVRTWPGPRTGHALVYLQPKLSKRLGCAKGALLMYGGSDIKALSLNSLLGGPDDPPNNATDAEQGKSQGANENGTDPKLAKLNEHVRNSTWDTHLWLYDVDAKTWSTLETVDPPPRLMYHAMTIAGSQLVMFAGLMRKPSSRGFPILQSTQMHVVDLSVKPLRWRTSTVINISAYGLYPLAFPCTGAATVPDQKVVALKHNKDLYVIPLPQTLQVTPTPTNLAHWGLTSLSVTAGDWVRLEAAGQQPVKLQQPLILSGDIIFTGAVAGQELGAAPGAPTLQCAAVVDSTAISIRSAGVVVENFVVRGCKGNAVNVTLPSTAVSSRSAEHDTAGGAIVKLRNLTFVANKGDEGAALRVGQNVSLDMRKCVFRNNIASSSVTQADQGSTLGMFGCEFTANMGTALAFDGSTLDIFNSRFSNNSASSSALQARITRLMLNRTGSAAQIDDIAAVKEQEFDIGLAADAGAIRLAQPEDWDGQRQDGSTAATVFVINTSFTGNVGGAGGAVFLGSYARAGFTDCSFRENAAHWRGGGAIFAHRDACLQVINSTFVLNTAQPSTWGGANRTDSIKSMHHGGAIWMQNPSCSPIFTGTRFEGNAAHTEGGAVAISDLTARNLKVQNCTFSANQALNGVGGAMSLHAVSSDEVLLQDCTLLNNTAREGGALYIHTTSTRVHLDNCTAAGNRAVGDTSKNTSFEEYASHHGGALSMSGSVSRLHMWSCRFHANTAQGQGGAISVSGADLEQGGTTSSMAVQMQHDTTFSSNTAARNGGAIYVARALLEMTSTRLSHNAVNVTAKMPVTSAGGGGLFCSECTLTIHDSKFTHNNATLGGGVALLRAKSANITSTRFDGNTATSSAGGSPAAMSDTQAISTSGEQGVSYLGGGGLYLETEECKLANLTFTQNTAPVAGGIYLELRRGTLNGTAVLTSVKLAPSNPAITSSSSSGTSGLLFNGPIDRLLVPSLYESPNSSPTHARCVAEALATWQAQAFTRRLLQEDAAGLMPSDPSSNPTTAAARNVFATTAVQLRLVQLNKLTEKWERRSLSGPMFANVSGEPLQDLSVQLLDALGTPVDINIRDASIPVVASVHSNGQPLDVAMINNVTNAKKGVATFSELSIWAPKGEVPSLELVFDTAAAELQQPLRIRLEVNRTGCQVGEYSKPREGQSSNTSAANLPFKCTECAAPLYSFIPEAEQCSVCPAKAVCNLYYALPLSGSYQSHPRNPLILDCLLPAACRRSEQQQKELQDIVQMLRNERTSNITPESISRYAAAMCSTGYEGPLCGACSKGFGRAGVGCTRCFSPAVHAALFVLVGVVMIGWILFQGWLHVSQVKRNHADVNKQQLANLVSRWAQGSGAGQPSMGSQGTSQLQQQQQQQQLQSQQQQQTANHLQQGRDQDVCPSRGYQQQMLELQTLGHVLPKHLKQQYSLPADAAARYANSDDVLQHELDTNQGLRGQVSEPLPGQQKQQQKQQKQPAGFSRVWRRQQQQQLSRSHSSSDPDSFTMSSPWVVSGRNDPGIAARLASDGDSRPGSAIGDANRFSVTQQQQQQQPQAQTQQQGPVAAAGVAGMGGTQNSGGSQPVQQQQHQKPPLPLLGTTAAATPPAGSGNQANGTAAAGATGATPAAAAAAAATAASAGSGGSNSASPSPSPLQPTGSGSLPVTTSIALQLRGVLSSMFSADVLHDAARMRWSAAVLSSQQGSSQAAGGALQQQQGVSAGEHTWIADMFKLLTSHLQLLGLLRPLRIKWPEALQKLLQHVDPSSALMAWARLDCSMADAAAVRRSVQRSVVLLLTPVVAAGAVALVWCLWVAYEWVQQRRNRSTVPVQSVRAHRWHYLVLYVVLTLFFLYPQVSKEIVSTLSCHPVDDPQKFKALLPSCPSSRCNMTEAQAALQYTGHYWSNDTLVDCFRGQHLVVVVLGVLGLAFFALGLPISLFVVLTKARSANRLEVKEVELQLGFLYASYRRRYYFWEGVVLLEKLAMVLSITLLQGVSVGLQVLMAIAVIFISASLQVTFQPFACKLLDTLQRISFYTLQITLFLLMIASFDEISSDGARLALLVVVAVLNAAVLALFLFFISRGVMLMSSNYDWAKARTWCSQKVGGQDWINTVTGKCDGCFKIKETVSAITSPAANHNSNNLPPATGGGTS